MKIARLREVGDKLGRPGMSELVLKAVEEFDGSYSGAMELCGKLEPIAKMSTCDDYWNEKVSIGRNKMMSKIHEINEREMKS